MRVVLFSLILAACAAHPYSYAPETVQTHWRSESTVFRGDPSFTPAERKHIENAMKAWRDRTEGRLNFGVTWTLTPEQKQSRRVPMIVKEQSDSPNTLEHERRFAKRYGVQSVQLYGWEEDEPATGVYLVTNTPAGAGASLQLLAEHELAHAAGMANPNCNDDINVCAHAEGEGHLLSRHWSGSAFDEKDLEFCRAARFCRWAPL